MAKVRLNREIKAFCPDFRPIRKLLRSIGATRVGVKSQTDYFYHLPKPAGGRTSRRLKLRLQSGGSHFVYYYDRNQSGTRSVEFQLFPLRDPKVKTLLEAALGVKAIVRKRREVWRRGNAKFHLDTVDSVGQVFEVELELAAARSRHLSQQLARYGALFGPYLGPEIIGSNEDLVAARTR